MSDESFPALKVRELIEILLQGDQELPVLADGCACVGRACSVEECSDSVIVSRDGGERHKKTPRSLL